LIIHGTADQTVPFSQGEGFAAALKEAGAKDVTFLEFKDAGHGVFDQHIDQTQPAMERFFTRTLKKGQNDRGTESEETTAVGRKLPGRIPAARRQRPRDQEPSWLMPPVDGPNLHYRTFEVTPENCTIVD